MLCCCEKKNWSSFATTFASRTEINGPLEDIKSDTAAAAAGGRRRRGSRCNTNRLLLLKGQPKLALLSDDDGLLLPPNPNWIAEKIMELSSSS